MQSPLQHKRPQEVVQLQPKTKRAYYLARYSVRLSWIQIHSQSLQTFGPPPCILIARTVATRTTQLGMRPRFG